MTAARAERSLQRGEPNSFSPGSQLAKVREIGGSGNVLSVLTLKQKKLISVHFGVTHAYTTPGTPETSGFTDKILISF